jgi:hypothetical protein
MPTAVDAPGSTAARKAGRKRGPAHALGGVCCPFCKADLPASARVDGHQRCPICSDVYEAVFFSPVVDPGPVIVPVAADGSGTPCAKHARNVAESSCQRCGSFMCALCRIDSDGKSFCPGCFERLSDEGALASSRSIYRDYGRLATNVALLSILIFPLMSLTGPVATWYGITGLRTRSASGYRISRLRCWFGIVGGLIEMVLGVAYFMLVAGKFS